LQLIGPASTGKSEQCFIGHSFDAPNYDRPGRGRSIDMTVLSTPNASQYEVSMVLAQLS
jgi:hypothetical protein